MQKSPPNWRKRLAALRLDVTPLRVYRDFRLLFVVGTVFYLGQMVSYVAVPYQLYHLTGSNFAVGALGLIQLVPLIVFGLYGGALADHVDRKIILIGTGAAQVVLTAGLLVNAALPEPKVWVIYLLGALLAVAAALQRPAREAIVPRIVAHDHLTAAIMLSSFGAQISILAGPAIGGLIIAGPGVFWAYAVDLVGLTVVTLLLFALRRYPPTDANTPPSVNAIVDGIRYAAGRKDLLGTYAIDMIAMFMAMPIVLYPALAADVLEQPTVLGLLYSAGTVGSLLATATSGWTNRVHSHGKAVVIAAAAWGASVAVAGLTTQVWLILLALVVAGAADMVSGVFRSVIWNQTIPDGKRGRLAGIEMLSYSIGPMGGEARAGLVADATSVRTSIVSGGIGCVIGVAAVATWLKDFWRYDARTDEHAVREREVRSAVTA